MIGDLVIDVLALLGAVGIMYLSAGMAFWVGAWAYVGWRAAKR